MEMVKNELTIKTNNKDARIDLLKFFLILLPFIDTLNGIMQLQFGINASLGTLYRFLFLMLCFLIFIDLKLDEFDLYAIFLLLAFFLILMFHREANIVTEFINLITFAIFPVTFITLKGVIKNNYKFIAFINNTLNYYCLIFPLTLVIPYLLGIGYTAYEAETGFRGYYIATNAISNTIIVTTILSLYLVIKNISLKNILAALLNLVSIILLGTKSGYLLTAFTVVLLIFVEFINNKKHRTKILMLFFSMLVLLAIGVIIFKDTIVDVFARWEHFYKQRSFISFLTSARSERIIPAWNFIKKSDTPILYFLFGYGACENKLLEYHLMEMDFFDLFFSYGIAGLTIFAVFLFKINKIYLSNRDKKRGSWSIYRFIYLIILLIAFLVGHVLFNALVSTIFAMVTILMCYVGRELKNEKDSALEFNL